MDTKRRAFEAFAAILIAVCSADSCVHAQSFARQVPTSESAPSATNVLLQEMTAAAGVIFAGQVVSVRRRAESSGSSADAASGTVEVVFRVDQALRGCTSGSSYTLREWAGLWAGANGRYRVGQRLLMFVRSTDANGLSSTVHGAEGAIPVRGGGAAPGPDDTNPEAAMWLVDLRWVQAQAPRNTLSQPRPIRWPVHLAAPNAVEDRQTERTNLFLRDDVPPWTVPSRPAGPEMTPLSQVLNLCRGFMRQSDDAR